ncbi:MAG TPA: protein kinase [Thermoanaerobaculia bacterium]
MKPDLPTDPERWQRIEALLDEAFERPAGERRGFLDEACVGDPELRAQMEALLAADEAAGGFLATPAHQAAAALLAEVSGEATHLDRELGPYRLVREIGSGGMGVVYEAEDTRLRRRVAIKLLPPELSRDRGAKERFLREARAASALDDPNICTVHDIGERDGQLYIIMAYYEGETLKERLARGPLPISEARQVAIEVARALARAHEAGIVHRDIKPANVMLTRHGKVKVLDFGIAKMRGDATLTHIGSSPGTPAYMSPEQVRGEPVDGRTDIWSLGALLYEMLAGCRPFPGDDEWAVLSAVQSRKAEPLERIRPEVPQALSRTVAKALAKDPAERHQSAAELLSDLELRPSVLSALRHWRRGRGVRAAVLALIVAAGVLLALLLKEFLWRPAAPPALRVAVLRPGMTSVNDPELAFVASDVTEAALAALISLEGVEPLDPPERDEERGSETERLRSSEADEVLLPVLGCHEGSCRLALRRLRKPGGAVLDTVGPFDVEAGVENSYQLADAVQVHLRQLYPDHHLRPGLPGGKIRAQDYSEYIELKHRVDRGERLGTGELARLDALLRTSPDLLGAWLLASGIARLLGSPDRALAYAARAQVLAPRDPRPLLTRLQVEVEGNRLDAARETLAKLTALAPGDVRVKDAKAALLETQGELQEAHRLRQEVAKRRPSWRHVLALATLEFRLGLRDSARQRLGALLVVQPANQYLRQTLAALETGFGDLKHAAALYEELSRAGPARPDLTNLGFLRFLLGDYAAAEKAYRQALALEPAHLLTRFNLAAALEAQGELPEARRLYRALAKELAAVPNLGDDRTRMLHAQCLVRLGQRAEAERLADEVLKKRPEDVQVLHQAAQIYALLGERYKTLYYTELALKKGMRREWFTIPEFRPLKEDQEFRTLLASAIVKP